MRNLLMTTALIAPLAAAAAVQPALAEGMIVTYKDDVHPRSGDRL